MACFKRWDSVTVARRSPKPSVVGSNPPPSAILRFQKKPRNGVAKFLRISMFGGLGCSVVSGTPPFFSVATLNFRR